MLGVEAHAQAIAFFRCIHHPCNLLEAVAETGTLPRSNLEGDFRSITGTRRVNFIDRARDGFDAFAFAGSEMRAGMGHQIGYAEHFAALEFINKPGDGLPSQFSVRRTEVEKVGIVSDDRSDSGFLPVLLENRNLFVGV